MPFYTARYRTRIEKSYPVRVITPMFLGGADNNKAEIRASSFKGLIRFWWRAFQSFNNPAELKKMEGLIFGSAVDKEMTRSSISLFITNINGKPEKKRFNFGGTFNIKGHNLFILEYLAFGPIVYNRDKKSLECIKEYFPAGTAFTLNIVYSNKDHIIETEKSLACMTCYGGAGSKSRNGYGSLLISNLSAEAIKFADDLVKKNNKSLMNYSSFSNSAETVLFSEHSSWDAALSEIGLVYKNARLATNIDNVKHEVKNRLMIAEPIMESKRMFGKRYSKPMHLSVDYNPENKKYRGRITIMPFKKFIGERQDNFIDVITKLKKNIIALKAKQNVPTIY